MVRGFEAEPRASWRQAAVLRHPLFGAGVLVLAVGLLYGHTLQVPFYLDDSRGLLENYRLRDLAATIERLFGQRGLTSLTFAFNYRLTGWSLPPLHLVNILLHAGCGLLVWRILLRLLGGAWLPLLGALLFVAHPLQTQGVTYLIQRATVLSAFLFLLAVLLHLRAREALAAGKGRRCAAYLRPYAGAVLSGACAVLAKEHTATLPLVLLAYERLFPVSGGGTWRRTLCDLLPYALVPLLLGSAMVASLAGAGVERVFDYPIASLQHNSPLHYLVTQFTVVWIYLRLLLVPYGQALEHNVPITAELLTLQSVSALTGLLLLGFGVWRLRRRLPLPAFGAAWFFLTLAVESSVIPLDPLFEHRLYLPMFGFVLVCLAVAPRLLGERWAWGVLALVLVVAMPLTWRRNALWNDPVAFYEDNLRRVPDSERASKALAALYEEKGRHLDSLRLLEGQIARYPGSYLLYGSLAKHYAALGQVERGLSLLEQGIRAQPANGRLYEEAAAISNRYGRDMPRAISYLQRGIEAAPARKGKLLNMLGLYYSETGAAREAEAAFLASLAKPAGEVDLANVHFNLAREYYFGGRWPESFAQLRIALDLSPGDPEILERFGELALRLGERRAALWTADRLRYADADAWQRYLKALRSAGWETRP